MNAFLRRPSLSTPKRDQVIEQLYALLAEQQKLLERPLTDRSVLQYKDREMEIRELFQLLDGRHRGP